MQPPASVGEVPSDTFRENKPPEHADDKPPPDPLFPERKAGWGELSSEDEKLADRLAVEYVELATAGKTPRRAVAALVKLASEAGSTELPADKSAAEPGALFSWVRPGGDAGLVLRVGKRPVTDGMRMIIAAVDSPRIDLKQTPVYDKAGLIMLDTFFYGPVDYKSWLVTPMALYLYAARPGSATGDIELVVGEAETDPVLSIPDLLPHLSRKVQRNAIVDSPERLDAVAASSRAALIAFLSGHAIDERTFEDAEAYLLPAGPATLVGADRGLIAAYGHSHKVLAFAAVKALLDEAEPDRTSVVVFVSNSHVEGGGPGGMPFVKTAISRILGALSEAGAETDLLDTRRTYARSAALLAARIEVAERNKGVAINTRADDALPAATRTAIDRMVAGGAQVQVTYDGSWQSATRSLGVLDIDAVGVGLPTTGYGTPMELLSVLDLLSGYRGFRGWITAQ